MNDWFNNIESVGKLMEANELLEELEKKLEKERT